jgi:hypothetical protein
MSEQLLKEQENRIEELTNEIAAMKTQAEESKNATAVKEAAAAAQTKPAAAPSVASQEIQRAKVIKETGGPAYYFALPFETRLRANGQAPASAEEIETSIRLFGSELQQHRSGKTSTQ